jgi:hypothetical protein
MEAWVGCLAGALAVSEYEQMLTAAGFEEVSMEITKRYMAEAAGLDVSTLPEGWEASDGKLASAFVRATKPVSAEVTQVAAGPTTSGRPVPIASTGGGCCGSAGGCC